MSTDPPLVPPRPRRPPPARITGSQYKALLLHARGLDISAQTVRQCATMGDLKPHVKRAFRALAKQWHPDVIAHARPNPNGFQGRISGSVYRKYLWRYEWFMRQADSVQLLPPETVPDLPLPDALAWREVALPWGFHETRDWLWWR